MEIVRYISVSGKILISSVLSHNATRKSFLKLRASRDQAFPSGSCSVRFLPRRNFWKKVNSSFSKNFTEKKTYLRRRFLTFSPSLLTREFRRRISSSRTSFSCSSKGLELLSSAMAWVIFSSRRVISVWSFDSCFRAFLYSAFNSCLSLLGRFSLMAESEPRSVWDPMIVPTPVESSLTWKKVRS